MQVYSLPVWIIARIERPSIDLELVGKDQVVRIAIEASSLVRGLWRMRVD